MAEGNLSRFVRLLRSSRALKGVEVLPGSRSLPMQTAPRRIVIYPSQGQFVEPGDRTLSIVDVEQQVLADLWGKGSSGGDAAAAQLADWNATEDLLVKFVQALAEQGENPTDPTHPGAFWETTGLAWDMSPDTTQQGTSIQVTCSARLPIAAASDDTGHVGDAWTQGTAEAVDINGAP